MQAQSLMDATDSDPGGADAREAPNTASKEVRLRLKKRKKSNNINFPTRGVDETDPHSSTSCGQNKPSSFPLELELEAVDFEMALDVEEQARLSCGRKRTADGEYKDQLHVVEGLHLSDDLDLLNVSAPDTYKGENLMLPSLPSPLSAPLPEPETVEICPRRDAHDCCKEHTMSEPKHSPIYDREKGSEPLRYLTSSSIPLYQKPSCGRSHHRRNTSSQSSHSSTSSSATSFSLQTHGRGFQLKSPYLGPVAWTVPPRNSSLLPKPFLIYQDPAWLEPPDVVVDSLGWIAASDDKENCPHYRRYSRSDMAATTTPISAEISPHIDGRHEADEHDRRRPSEFELQLFQANFPASADSVIEVTPPRVGVTSLGNAHRSSSSLDLGLHHYHRNRLDEEELLPNLTINSSMAAPFVSGSDSGREEAAYARTERNVPREFESSIGVEIPLR